MRKEKSHVTVGMCLFCVIDGGKSEASILTLPRASGSVSRLRLQGKSNRRSRVVDFGGRVLEGSVVVRTEHEVQGNPPSMDR